MYLHVVFMGACTWLACVPCDMADGGDGAVTLVPIMVGVKRVKRRHRLLRRQAGPLAAGESSTCGTHCSTSKHWYVVESAISHVEGVDHLRQRRCLVPGIDQRHRRRPKWPTQVRPNARGSLAHNSENGVNRILKNPSGTVDQRCQLSRW